MNVFPNPQASLEKLCASAKSALEACGAVIVGAGAGLSASAGFTYSGARFDYYFSDFHRRYGFNDMYSGGFYPFETLEEYWAYWSRYIYINRYMNAPKPVYEDLLTLVSGKNYFVLTTNVDHCFQKSGFDKERLFYTQGDYGLFQCSAGTTKACVRETFDNRAYVEAMLKSQGCSIEADASLKMPREAKMFVDSPLIPRCPHCRKPMTVNLRSDDSFVQDDGWEKAAQRYRDFLTEHRKNKIVFLELGVGANTPGIIKYPFRQMTAQNAAATYICINTDGVTAPKTIEAQSLCIKSDIGAALALMKTEPL